MRLVSIRMIVLNKERPPVRIRSPFHIQPAFINRHHIDYGQAEQLVQMPSNFCDLFVQILILLFLCFLCIQTGWDIPIPLIQKLLLQLHAQPLRNFPRTDMVNGHAGTNPF